MNDPSIPGGQTVIPDWPLSSILDKLGIYHILDEVMFFAPFDAADRMKAIHKVKVWKVERDGSVSLKNRFGHSGRFKYRKLVIPTPGLFDINITEFSEWVVFIDKINYTIYYRIINMG